MKRRQDLPGGPDLISSLAQAAENLSLIYAGTPDDGAQTHLKRYIETILPDLAEAVGPSMSALMVREFAVAVMNLKHRLEGAGSSRA